MTSQLWVYVERAAAQLGLQPVKNPAPESS